MDFFSAMDISATGLITQRYRMNIASENLANIESTRTIRGGPYRRKQVVISALGQYGYQGASPLSFVNVLLGVQSPTPILGGARVTNVVEDQTPFRMAHRPGHPDADQNGYVRMPNVNAVLEMADVLTASRAYEANITAFSTSKSMVAKALELAK